MALDTRWKNPQGSDPRSLHLWAQELVKELRRGEFFTTQIGSGITNAQLAEMAAWTIKARNNSAAGAPEDANRAALTAAAAPAIAHELLGFLSTNELRRFGTGLVGGLQLLNSGTVSNAATLDIVLTSYTGYRALKLLLSSFVPATDDVELWMRFSTDGGANFDATGYRWSMRGLADDGGSRDRSSGASNQILIAGGSAANDAVSNTAAEGGVDAEIVLHAQAASRWSGIRFHSSIAEADSSVTSFQAGHGRRATSQDTDAVRFLFESGNIASGNWALYGYA
jgi:hypothetical protein